MIRVLVLSQDNHLRSKKPEESFLSVFSSPQEIALIRGKWAQCPTLSSDARTPEVLRSDSLRGKEAGDSSGLPRTR